MSFLRAALFATLSAALLLFAGLASAQEHVKCVTQIISQNSKAPTALDSMPNGFRDSITSLSGRFIIHYNATASVEDSTTPIAFAQRAAEECDSAYDFEIGELGYAAPPFTDGAHYHIFLSPLHRMALRPYGETVALELSRLANAPSGTKRFRCWCAIENSFPDSIYATTGYNALRTTIFHEFFHVVQFSEYGMPPVVPNYIFFQEMSSVWMEWRSTPNVKDYLQYVKYYLKNLELRFDLLPDLGKYGQYLYLAYLSNRFGDSIVRECWENYRDKTNDPITAIDLALAAHGTNWCSEYEKFGEELMHAGGRFNGSSLLPDAPFLPVNQINIHWVLTADDVQSRIKFLLEARQDLDTTTDPFRKRFDSTQILRDSIALKDSIWLFHSFALSLQFAAAFANNDTCFEVIARDTNRQLQSDGMLRFASIGLPPQLTLDEPAAYCINEVCETPLSVTSPNLSTFPNPFFADGNNQVYIVTTASKYPPLSVNLEIYNTRFRTVRNATLSNVPFNNTWTVVWDGRDDQGRLVESGEYIFRLKVEDHNYYDDIVNTVKIGKIVLVRKS